jgi:hypothetical protein
MQTGMGYLIPVDQNTNRNISPMHDIFEGWKFP